MTIDVIKTLQMDRVAMAERMAKLEKALVFYADEKNWATGVLDQIEPGLWLTQPSLLMKDRGQRAREALGDE